MPTRHDRYWTPLPVPGNPKVSLAVAAYRQPDEVAGFLYCLRAQTYSNWEAVVVHDGPGAEVRAVVERVADPRVRLVETPERRGGWGHPWRQAGIDACTGEYVGLSNADNYYVPVYFEWMLHELVTRPADLAHCDMVHSHRQWAAFPTEPRKHRIDLGAWVARAALVRATPWTDLGYDGDGTFVEALARKARVLVHVRRCLFVHN